MPDQTMYLDLIRLLVKNDAEAYRQRCAELDAEGWDGFGIVVAAAFFLAVERGLPPTASNADVIRLVADTRAEIQHTDFDLDPKAAETLIHAARTGKSEEMETLPPQVVIENEMLLVWKLLSDMTDSELSEFLARVDTLAKQWQQED